MPKGSTKAGTKDGKEFDAADLTIPIYLNQEIVFDLLAILEDGFSTLTTIKTSTGETQDRKTTASGSIGVSNVFALLGVSFGGEYARESNTQAQSEQTKEKIHTPTSLFARLRMSLRSRGLKQIHNVGDVEALASGDFVEFRAILRKNPLVDALDGMKQITNVSMRMTQVSESPRPKPGEPVHGGRVPKQQDTNKQLVNMLDTMRAALIQEGSIEMVGELLDAHAVTAVLSATLDFFSRGRASDVIDGEFRVLGKVVRTVRGNSDESINLLRKTDFSRFDPVLLEQLMEPFAKLQGTGINIPVPTTEIKGPAFLAIPIAIFV